MFFAIHTVPGDPARIVLAGSGSGGNIDPAALEQTRERLGLNEPLFLQYLSFLFGILQLDFGTSFRTGRPVLESILYYLPNTLEIVGFAVLVSLIMGILLGVLSAQSKGVANKLVTVFTSLGVSLPVYVTGTVLVFVFAVTFNIFPSGGYTEFSADPAKHVRLLVLPVIAIAIGLSSVLARISHASIVETKEQDYVRTAKALGLHPVRAFLTAVLRNSLIPVITIAGLELGTLIGSTVVIERVFSWPGLSSLLFDAVSNRDYPLVQGVVMVTAALFIIVNLVVDVVYSFLNPKIRQTT